MTGRELADERTARSTLYGRRSGTVDVLPLVESNHAMTECENGHVVRTVQRGGTGPAFFPRTCPACAGDLPDVYGTTRCLCGDPDDCNHPKAAHA